MYHIIADKYCLESKKSNALAEIIYSLKTGKYRMFCYTINLSVSFNYIPRSNRININLLIALLTYSIETETHHDITTSEQI